MSDIIDRAQAQEEMAQALARAHRCPEGPAATGHCLWCGETLHDGRWCDRECRDEWERERRLRGRA